MSKMYVNVDNVATCDVVSDNDSIGIDVLKEEYCITLPTTSTSLSIAQKGEHVNNVPTDDLFVSFYITIYYVQ